MSTYSKKRWEVVDTINEEKVDNIASELGCSPFFVKICMQRGLDTIEKIRHFIHVDENWFHDPLLMHDMEKAVTRIVTALEENEKITVYGDYDADGMTSTAVLVEALDSLGANVNYYLPSRFVEGYGPNIEAFKKIKDSGTSLIITVDNGVAGHDAINFIQEHGVDVIVTDHHELPETLVDSYALIHPAHPQGNYPFKELAGVGVALKLTQALLGDIPAELLELAAIGTVADLVPLKDENRAIVYFGLKMLKQTQRIGLLQLFALNDVSTSDVTEETIGFQISPRLNAVGRLGDPTPCVELLLTHDLEKAQEIATFVNETNEQRKEIVENMVKDVEKQLVETTEQDVIVLANKEWHQGVLGIVASRIVERTNKVVLLFTIDSQTNLAKGSARSIEGFNLYAAIEAISDLFEQFGGHAMAAGMTVKVDNLESIQSKLNEIFHDGKHESSALPIDAIVELDIISNETIREVAKLRPFGAGNEKPLVSANQVIIAQKRSIGANGNHLKLLVEQDGAALDIISFQNGHINDLLFNQQVVSVAGYLDLNEWNGHTKPQMQMIDIDIPGPVLIDNRTNKLSATHFNQENVEYIFYQNSTYEEWKQYIPTSSSAVLLGSDETAKDYHANKSLIIVDCPQSTDQFKLTVWENEAFQITCYFFKENHLFLTGLPSYDDFVKVYKFVAKYPEIDLKKHGHLFVKHLKMDKNKIYLIVKVFSEAKFVIIDNGVLKYVEHPEKKDLKQTKTYLKANDQFKAEELFLYSSFNEVVNEFLES